MGFTPRDIKEMSMWEYSATVTVWKNANGASDQDSVGAPSDEEFRAIVEQYAD